MYARCAPLLTNSIVSNKLAVAVDYAAVMQAPAARAIAITIGCENWDLDDFADDTGIWRVGPEVEL